MKLHFLVLVSVVAFCVGGCTHKSSSNNRTVNLAIWSNYVSPELLEKFTKETGIKVQISNYSSNEELLAKLQAGASGYDVVVPSDYMVFAMTKLGLLRPLDFNKISRFKSVDPRFTKKTFDPENKYSVPYDWGTTGIAVNRKLYQGQLKGWKDVFGNPALAGKFTLLDDIREVVGAALKAQGLSMNTTKPEDLQKAKELLLKVRASVKAFTSEPMMPLVNGETAVAHVFMSDALQAARTTGGKIEYVVPEEGGTLWIDNLVIPATATNVQEAHEFINFLLDAKSNMATVMSVLVAPANSETLALLPKEVRENPSLFPTKQVMARLEMLQDLGDSIRQWDRVWTEIKAEPN